MCVAIRDAGFGKTTIACWRSRLGDQTQHVWVYGNQPTNRSGRPNAIVLHVATAEGAELGPENFLPTAGLSSLLDDMWSAVPRLPQPLSAGSFGFSRGAPVAKGVQVFQSGAYTWVTAGRTTVDAVRTGLSLVDAAIRPEFPDDLLEFYMSQLGRYSLAIGCFPNSAKRTEPVAVRYPPAKPDVLEMPGIDAHGFVPRLTDRVEVNHRLIVGAAEFGEDAGGEVRYSEQGIFHPQLAVELPRRVIGYEMVYPGIDQGDFYVDFNRPFKEDKAGCGQFFRGRGWNLDESAFSLPMPLHAQPDPEGW